MIDKFKKEPLFIVGSIALFLIFIYLRIEPIIHLTVPFTFDQGRDFLKAMEIVSESNITFIGPTTGLPGLFHGVWWYYFLIIPYIIFQGAPIGFYVFILMFTFLQTILFFLFLRKDINMEAAFIFLLLITGSSYFILMSFFAISSVFAMPFILLLLFSLLKYLKTNNNLFLFLVFISLASIFEAEFAFGVFIIPSFILTVVLLRKTKDFFGTIQKLVLVALGLILPMIPRILFDLKNNLLQSRTILSFLSNPSAGSQKTIEQIINSRATLFIDYYLSLFPDKNVHLATIVGLLTLSAIVISFKKLSQTLKTYTLMISIIPILMFLLSLFYKENVWSNYFEGLSYFYILLIAIGFYCSKTISNKVIRPIFILVAIVIFILLGKQTLEQFNNWDKVKVEGLGEQIKTVEYIFDQVKNDDYCVKVYTPPVIPHTYNYVFSYNNKFKNRKKPKDVFVKNKCFFIIEKDDYAFRTTKWKENIIPKEAKLLSTKKISVNTKVELWQRK